MSSRRGDPRRDIRCRLERNRRASATSQPFTSPRLVRNHETACPGREHPGITSTRLAGSSVVVSAHAVTLALCSHKRHHGPKGKRARLALSRNGPQIERDRNRDETFRFRRGTQNATTCRNGPFGAGWTLLICTKTVTIRKKGRNQKATSSTRSASLSRDSRTFCRTTALTAYSGGCIPVGRV